MLRFETIAFDAGDTLWHNERLYVTAQSKLKTLLAQYDYYELEHLGLLPGLLARLEQEQA